MATKKVAKAQTPNLGASQVRSALKATIGRKIEEATATRDSYPKGSADWCFQNGVIAGLRNARVAIGRNTENASRRKKGLGRSKAPGGREQGQ